jgi:prevent-host-death family protein
MEYQIGTTDLRQKLTDVLESVREEGATYVIETFGRPQAAIVSLEEYRQFQQYWQERHEFFQQLDAIARDNAVRNADMSEEEVLALIEQVRQEVYDEKMRPENQR